MMNLSYLGDYINMKFSDWYYKEQDLQDNNDNLFPPSMDAQIGLDMLCDYLLGPDWYVSYPCGQGQVNTEIVYSILFQYSKKFKLELKSERR